MTQQYSNPHLAASVLSPPFLHALLSALFFSNQTKQTKVLASEREIKQSKQKRKGGPEKQHSRAVLCCAK
jgi:hypothetical protein